MTMNIKLKSLTVCLDMRGCPNRCRHCWLGAAPNGHMTVSDLEAAAEQFRPYADSFEIFDWYREPDFGGDYREMWELCRRLSDRQTGHFELVSFWRLVRDEKYADWLASLGLKSAQLTLFGGEETTDRYIGRKGAYRELLQAIDILLCHGIAPRIQAFVNRENLSELWKLERLISELRLEERCREIGADFAFFLHQGSCDGENEKLYDIRVTPEDIAKIPPALAEYTLRYFGKSDLPEVFGRTEGELCRELLADQSTESLAGGSPVIYIDRDFDAYPNISAPESHWRLGNLKRDRAGKILGNYAMNLSPAQHIRSTVPLCELASVGNPDGRALFSRDDYIIFLLNRYCRKKSEK